MPTDPNDFETVVYKKIWDLLEASEPWTNEVPEGNRIRYDTDSEETDPEKEEEVDGDYPRAELQERSGSDNLRTSSETFGTHGEDGCPTWSETGQLVYRLILTTELMSQDEMSRLGKLSRDALRAGGARLNLPFITGVRLRWETSMNQPEADKDMRRFTTNLDIFIDYVVEGSTLGE